jgi:hypothetical protein
MMLDLTVILYGAETKAEKALGNGFRQASGRDCGSPGGSNMIDPPKPIARAERVEAACRGDV